MRGNKILKLIYFGFFLYFLFGILIPVDAKSSSFKCIVYFSGIGCPHCAKTDPFLFERLLKKYPELVIIDYEVYKERENSQVLSAFFDSYKVPPLKRGIPIVFLGEKKEEIIVGDLPILENLEKKIKEKEELKCFLVDGRKREFEKVKLSDLPGYPKIWRDERVLIKTKKENEWIFAWNGEASERKYSQKEVSFDFVFEVLKAKNVKNVLENINYFSLPGPFEVSLSGKKISFQNAIKLKIASSGVSFSLSKNLTIAKILSLALVDAINPCAFAVLVLMLTAILVYGEKRKKVLYGGLSFVLAVFLMYFLYGILIVKFFQIIQFITPLKFWLYKILGGVAVVLGILNIKDFIKYQPGGLFTEMPIGWRQRVRRLIYNIPSIPCVGCKSELKIKESLKKSLSPIGCFVTGLLVTFFLLPCTIGPYIVAGGILSTIELIKSLPWLFLYNVVFVLPMILIVGLVYVGWRQVKDISKWKEENITKFHLIAGIIMLTLGISMIFGLF